MALEGSNQRKIWLRLGQSACRLFRLNSGKAWLSGLGPKGVQRLKDGSVLIQAARPVALGLTYPNGDPVKGQSDLGGFTPVVITEDMVGKTLPVFTAIETKRSKGGRTSVDQASFIDLVKRFNGIAGVANSEEAAANIVDDWHAAHKQKSIF